MSACRVPQVLAHRKGDDSGRQARSSHGALPNIRPESSVMLGKEGAGENSRRMQYLNYREWKSICKNGSSMQELREGPHQAEGRREVGGMGC